MYVFFSKIKKRQDLAASIYYMSKHYDISIETDGLPI